MGNVIPIDDFRKSNRPGFESMFTLCCQEFQPQGLLEMDLVEELAHHRCRLNRIHLIDPEPPDDSPSGATAVFRKAA